MREKLRTLVIFCEDRFRKECRHQLGRVECAKIVQEVPFQEGDFSPEVLEEIASLAPEVLFLELNRDPEVGLHLLREFHKNFPNIAILAVAESLAPNFLIEALRLGVKEVLPKPLNPDGLQQAYLRIYKHAYDSIVREPASIFSFFSCKGGSGCTGIASNFAVSLARLAKKKILILDLDVEIGEVADFFGVKNEKFLVQEGPRSTVLDSGLISRTIVSHSKTGIDLLSFSDGLGRKARGLADEVRPLLGMLQKEYDYIVVDAASSLNSLAVSALDSSHLIFLVSKCSLPALRNTQRMLHGFERLGYSSDRLRIVINRYLKGKDISLKEVEKVLSFKVFWSIPNDYKSFILSIQSGEPLTLQNDSIPVAKSFYAMSAAVLGIKVQQNPKYPGGGLQIGAKARADKLSLTTLNLLKS
jgi:pilus assembly protein CpaE